jgi:hypothetical protein
MTQLALKCPDAKCGWEGTMGTAISHNLGYDCPQSGHRVYTSDAGPAAAEVKTTKSAAPSGQKARDEAAADKAGEKIVAAQEKDATKATGSGK